MHRRGLGGHSRPRQRTLLQSGRPRQSVGAGESRRSQWAVVREAVALRSHRHRRTRLSAVQPTWRPVVVPPDQQTLRKYLAADHHQSGLRRLAASVRRRQNDNRHARSADPPLRHHRDRQRQLALQEPRITPFTPLAAPQDRLCSAMWGSATPVSAPSEGSFLDAKRGRTWMRFDIQRPRRRSMRPCFNSVRYRWLPYLRSRCPPLGLADFAAFLSYAFPAKAGDVV